MTMLGTFKVISLDNLAYSLTYLIVTFPSMLVIRIMYFVLKGQTKLSDFNMLRQLMSLYCNNADSSGLILDSHCNFGEDKISKSFYCSQITHKRRGLGL